MASPKRTKRQREFDLQEISTLYLQGWIQARIASYLADNRSYQVTQQTISRDIRTIQERWLKSSLVDYDTAKAKEVAKLDELERISWESWQSSKDPTVKRKTAKKVDGQTTEATQEVLLETGNTKFLDIVLRCIDRRIKLLGLDAPVKTQHSGPEGGPIPFSISDMSKATAQLKAWENDRQSPDDPTT